MFARLRFWLAQPVLERYAAMMVASIQQDLQAVTMKAYWQGRAEGEQIGRRQALAELQWMLDERHCAELEQADLTGLTRVH